MTFRKIEPKEQAWKYYEPCQSDEHNPPSIISLPPEAGSKP